MGPGAVVLAGVEDGVTFDGVSLAVGFALSACTDIAKLEKVSVLASKYV